MFEVSSLGISIIQQGARDDGRKRMSGEDKQGEGIPLAEAILHARYQYDGLLSYLMRQFIGQTHQWGLKLHEYGQELIRS